MRALVIVVALAAAGGCGKGDGKAGAGGGSGRGVDTVLLELASARLPPTDVGPADGAALGQGDCKRAKVDGVDLTLCSYPDAGKARAAEPAGLAAVGEATGAAISHDHLMLVVVDRGKADPDGKKIDRITKVFLQKGDKG